MSNFRLWRQPIDSLICFGSAEQNRSLCEEGRSAAVSGNLAALKVSDLQDDQF